MAYRVRFDPVALRHIEELAAYLSGYSEDFAIEQIDRLDRIIALNIAADVELFRLHGSTVPRLPLSRRPSDPILDHLHG